MLGVGGAVSESVPSTCLDCRKWADVVDDRLELFEEDRDCGRGGGVGILDAIVAIPSSPGNL